MQISHTVPLWVTWAPLNCHCGARVETACTVEYCMSLSLSTSPSARPRTREQCEPSSPTGPREGAGSTLPCKDAAIKDVAVSPSQTSAAPCPVSASLISLLKTRPSYRNSGVPPLFPFHRGRRSRHRGCP